MSENVTIIGAANQADDIEYKLEKAAAIISTLQNGIFEFPEMTPDILTDKNEQAHHDMQGILLQYDDSKLLIGILLDYVADSKQLIEKLSKDLMEINKTLSAIKTVA